MKPLVKICGITSVSDALCAAEYGADMLGLIFAESPRSINYKSAELIVSKLSGKVKFVGVFAEYDIAIINEICNKIDLDMLQIYFPAQNSPEPKTSVKIIRSYWIKSELDLRTIDIQKALLDFKQAPEFLNGSSDELMKYDFSSTILAGGLNCGNITEVINRFQPFGVDAASGVESSPGIKDKEKLKEFISKVKK